MVTLSGFSALRPGGSPGHGARWRRTRGGEDSLGVPDRHRHAACSSACPRATCSFRGSVVSALGIVFGLVIFFQLKNAPVHKSMLEVSELIYETCKTYLFTQAKFLGLLVALHRRRHRRLLRRPQGRAGRHRRSSSSLFSIVGIAGSALVALFGIRVNTFANSRTAFASLRGKPFPVYAIPLKAGMSIGMLLISIELAFMLGILRSSRTSTRASASSASPSASRSAPRRCASRAASSRRSPTSGRTS